MSQALHFYWLIDTTGSQAGSTLLVERTKDTILFLAVLLKAKFKVDFGVGTEEDVSFGGTLRTPEGHTINLMFRDNLWHVPMWRPPISIKPTTGAPGVLSDVITQRTKFYHFIILSHDPPYFLKPT